ncbi:MAG: NAD(P)-binding protein [Deltaproteobacteria bacterium]|nr:NAD(P)-binding protein [Deltaproteobacteria bacterium]
MAWLLQRRGFKNIVVLESQERVGGKIYSYERDGIPHELGACYTQPAYHSIHELLHNFNLHAPIPVAGRTVYRDSGKPMAFGDDVIKQIRRTMGGFWKILPKKAIGIGVVLELQRYKRIHRNILGSYTGQLPPRPPEHILRDLSTPFLTWLKNHELDLLVSIFRLFQSAQGYGYLETVPALYGLMWNTPEVIDIATQQMSGKGKGASLVKTGMGSVLDAMVQDMDVAIHTQERVIEVVREDCIHLKTINPQNRTSAWEADELIVAAPHKAILNTLKVPTSQERELFSSLESSIMTTTLQSGIQPTCEKIDSWFDNIVPGRDHQVITQRCSQAFISPEKFREHSPTQPIERVVYQYGEQGADVEAITGHYQRYQCAIDIKDHEVIKRCHWPDYFPHWTEQGIIQGNPWRLLDMQGQHNTWWIGSSACFESINDVFEYNLRICDRYIDSPGIKRLQR